MELEEMKNAWSEMNNSSGTPSRLTTQLLDQMTQNNYRSKINRIGQFEYMGSIICYLAAAYLLANFAKIETMIMQVFAFIAIALLLVLPIVSIRSLCAVKNINISSNTYLDTIKDFGIRKIRFQRLQKLNVSLGFLLMLIILPVFASIRGKDISQIPYFWSLIFPLAIAFFLAFAGWTLRSYNRMLQQTENMLRSIEAE
ncbi:hypothetical protein LZZ85_00285 [Terrimonas sp. NA20]|uniref:DUF2975 domain-containing protein n=1 Tax=Terrimonas ginsenosidimutans TaxID=2908004 RepID=A0ABS9KK36_9BACT|nr:hypothetical protein [Terrimonas ginsenosidimutans]MCG2612687.1 hypothetical protein [Terrimonas ginsenosidimutans]